MLCWLSDLPREPPLCTPTSACSGFNSSLMTFLRPWGCILQCSLHGQQDNAKAVSNFQTRSMFWQMRLGLLHLDSDSHTSRHSTLHKSWRGSEMSEADGDTQGEAAEWHTLVADCTRRKELLCECMS